MTPLPLTLTLSTPNLTDWQFALMLLCFLVAAGLIGASRGIRKAQAPEHKWRVRCNRAGFIVAGIAAGTAGLFLAHTGDRDDHTRWQREEAAAILERWHSIVPDPGQLPGLDVTQNTPLLLDYDHQPVRCTLDSYQQNPHGGWNSRRASSRGNGSLTVRLDLTCHGS